MIPRVAIVTLAAIVGTCAAKLKFDFSKLVEIKAPFYKLPAKQQVCLKNFCDLHKPFACTSTDRCIRIKQICDGQPDCENGMDENRAMCNAALRLPVEDLYEYLHQEKKWMMPLLFNNADIALTAHMLAVASDMNDLRKSLKLSDKNVANLHTFFKGVIEGDPRSLLKLGMPQRSYNELTSVFDSIYKGGFKP